MDVKLVKDFLLYINDCHQALADLYLRLSLEATDHKVKLLLEYMKNKEQLSNQSLNKFMQEAPLSLLNTHLEDSFDKSLPLRCKNLNFKSEIMIRDITNLAMQLDMQLIDVMQTAAFTSHTIEAEIALEMLTNQEEEMLHQAVMASYEFEYI